MLPIDHFFRAAARFPDRIAVKDGAREITYLELALQSNALAAALQDIDRAPQSRVGICAYNTYEHLLAWLATFAAGKTWVPLNPRNGSEELARILAVTNTGTVIIDADCAGKIDFPDARAITGKAGKESSGGDSIERLLERFEGQAPQRYDHNLDDIQAIKFTGGSSGQPKGVLQTYRVWNACIATMLVEYGFDQDDRHLIAAPMTHGANTFIMPVFAVGGCQLFMGPAKPAAILEAMERGRATTMFLPPTVIYMMMEEPDIGTRDFSSLRHLVVGGAAIRKDEVPRAMKIFNNAFESSYGQTEAPQVAVVMRASDWTNKANWASCGRASCLTRVEVMDTEGNILPQGESGEIVFKGDLVMKGYLDMPEKTAETIVNGWLHTGDIGMFDEHGFLFIKDRIRDVVITGGFNVYPSDVEAALGRHPAVTECVVFGVPDQKWGEAVHAAVELRAGAAVTSEEIMAFTREHLDPVKTPKAVHFVDELPRSPVGKVLRREAREMCMRKEEEQAK